MERGMNQTSEVAETSEVFAMRFWERGRFV